jgi:hypothetical protein
MVATSPSILPTSPTATSCNKCVINTTSTTESFVPTTALLSGAVYHWQVRAEGTSGQGGYWSQRRNFTTIPLGSGIVSITSVAPGAVINDFSVLVRGFVNVPFGTEAGVTVNGFVAFVDLGQFAVEVPVDESVTGLTVVAKNAAEAILGTQTIPITVQRPTVPQTLVFRSSPAIGQAPLIVGFTLTSLKRILRVDLDGNGDGTVDFQGTTLKDQEFVYEGPGLYFPKVTLTDITNNTYTETAILLVLAQPELNVLLQSKWTAMKTALRNNDISSAVQHITINRRNIYRDMFNTLNVPLTSIDQVLGDITFVKQLGSSIEYEMLRVDGGSQFSYMVRFVLDEDGIWRIRFF